MGGSRIDLSGATSLTVLHSAIAASSRPPDAWNGLNLSQSDVGERCSGVSTPGEAVGTAESADATEVPFDLEAVFRAHYGRITGIIARVVRDPARAEELAVEVFLKLRREPKAQGDRTTGWLYRTAVRQGLDELRRHIRQARYAPLLRLVGGVPSPEETATAGEERGRVRLILSVLRRDQASLLLLRSHDLRYDELAETLDLNPTSVGTLLRRARQAFRKEYVRRYGDA